MKNLILFVTIALLSSTSMAGTRVNTAYQAQKVVYEFYFDDPEDINAALYWIRSLMNPMTEDPYNISPDDLSIKVIVHGVETVTLAKKNYKKYTSAVDRMRYYSDLGVEFKVCALASKDFGYEPKDYHDFVQVVPSAFTELAHWQMKGYAFIRPLIYEKKFTTESIR